MIRRPPRSTLDRSSAASDVYKRQVVRRDDDLLTWSQRYHTDPDAASVRALLADGGVDLDDLELLAVTGGRHRVLPELSLIHISEPTRPY